MTLLHTLQIETSRDIYGELLADTYSQIHADEFHLSPEMRHWWDALVAEYPHMPADEFLPGNGRYRYRRFDRFYFNPNSGELRIMPHVDYFQDTDINQVTGGIVRKFAPLTDTLARNPFLHELIRFDFAQFPMSAELRAGTWQVDVHMIRVVARAGEQGHPTPEGIHRDGGEYVTVHLAELDNVAGGEVSIYDDNRAHLASFTLQNVMDAYLFRDEVLWHGVAPLRPWVGNEGVRSILTFDYHYRPALQRPE